VFENLVENAASLSPAGSLIEVDSQRAAGEVVVTVADRGPGIPEAHMHRIFERFFSYRPDTDRRAHMGLGLPIARAVVEGHGGRITARNRPGGGAEFEVRLPAGAEPVQ
jgi:signal transduction histidine kinase